MAGSTILVIDADLATRNYLATALIKEGHKVIQAASGREGLIAAWRDRPDVIVADPVLPDLTGEDLAARLRADARTAKVPLVALSSDPQQARLRSCKAAGFNEYMVKTVQVMPSLISTVTSLLGSGSNAVKEGGWLIVFLSAKGGTGTSSLCANIAMNIAMSQPESRVAVMDLVLPIGSIAGIVGYQSEENLVTITQLPASETTPDFFRENLAQLESWRFHLLPGSPDPEHGNALVVGRIGDMVAGLKSAYDYVLLDLGRSLSRISLPLIQQADLVTMVIGADISTVALSKTVWEYLQSKGLQSSSVFTILNRAVGLEGVTKAEAEKIIGIPIQTSMPYLGANLTLANNQHQPYSVKFPTDTASIVLRDTGHQMIDLVKRTRTG
jgi:pilus assembly protein CpaE